MSRLGIQLHTLRDRPEPLPGLLREVAVAGFDGVEFAGRFASADPRQVGAALDGTHLDPIAGHVDLDELVSRADELLPRYREIGCDRLVIPHLPIERFRTTLHVEELATDVAALADELDREGFELAIHTTRELLLPFFGRSLPALMMNRDGAPRGAYNHLAWASALGVERTRGTFASKTPLGLLSRRVPGVAFEIDSKSVATAGFDIADVLEELDGRIAGIHLSDVRRSRRFPPDYDPVQPGSGLARIDVAAAEGARHDVDWLIAEHDAPPDPASILSDLGHTFERTRTPPSTPV